jgi:hypothetical protein
MEDSTWEGWTTPQPSGPLLGYPAGRKLSGGAPAGWIGQLRPMTPATDETIKLASRTWPQVWAEGFDRDGRRYVERNTGIEFQLVHGNPLAGDDPDVADCFFAEDDALWFLRRVDRPEARSKYMGSLTGWQG